MGGLTRRRNGERSSYAPATGNNQWNGVTFLFPTTLSLSKYLRPCQQSIKLRYLVAKAGNFRFSEESKGRSEKVTSFSSVLSSLTVKLLTYLKSKLRTSSGSGFGWRNTCDCGRTCTFWNYYTLKSCPGILQVWFARQMSQIKVS